MSTLRSLIREQISQRDNKLINTDKILMSEVAYKHMNKEFRGMGLGSDLQVSTLNKFLGIEIVVENTNDYLVKYE